MNPEFLSDGFLLENKEAFQTAFGKDPKGALDSLFEEHDTFKKELLSLQEKLKIVSRSDLIDACGDALEKLLKSLPKSGRLFLAKEEKEALLLPVCRFLSRLDELRPKEWEVLAALSDLEKNAQPLLLRIEQLSSTLSSATTAGESFDFFPALQARLESSKEDRKTLLELLTSIQKRHEDLSRLDAAFFGALPQELSDAADLLHNGKNATLASVARILGEAKAFLSTFLKTL